MCGIAGLLTRGRVEAATVRAMADTLTHRGPDDGGVWIDQDAGIGLGHRRLSIIDLSPAGHQPMASRCGRYVLTYNGEIYNFAELRAQLPDIAWRGHSDSEVLIEAIARWGLRATLERAVGMFAIGVWDREARTLSLARDRMGEKPLYYGWVGEGVAFGSELKALRRAPGFANAIDRDVLGLYLRLNYVPSPWSIYRDIYKVEPATIVTLDAEALAAAPGALVRASEQGRGIRCERYWSLDPVLGARRGQPDPDPKAAIDALEERLVEAIAQQTVADVPVGAFLSGGIDSSTIVALLSRRVGARVKTFTIGFEEVAHDEADHARAVAAHLGLEHRELVVTSADALGVIPDLPRIYDEPFADSSQIPTHLLSRLARREVTVALSGDAGDELFCGYNRYTLTRRLWSPLSRLPASLRRGAAGLVTAIAPGAWDRLGTLPLLPDMPMLGAKAHKFAGAMKSDGALGDLYAAFTEEWHEGVPMHDIAMLPTREAPERDDLSHEEQMMLWDMASYLPADILCKVDRAAMAASLETRVPFLDHRVVEQAWSMPLSLKLRGSEGKWALRQVLYRHVPRELIDRPKAGFGIPVGEWLRGPLRDWAEDLLSERALCDGPGFDVPAIRARWQQHLRGTHSWTAALWSVLMYQAWSREQSTPC